MSEEINLQQLINKSGDSKLLNYEYQSGILKFTLEMDELDCDITIEIITNTLKTEPIKGENKILQTCRLELTDLATVLQAENNVFVPHKDFGRFMQEIKSNVYLGYGYKTKAKVWLFSIVGYQRLISCIVEDLNSIRWTISL